MSPGTFLQHLKAIEGPHLAGPRRFRTGSQIPVPLWTGSVAEDRLTNPLTAGLAA